MPALPLTSRQRADAIRFALDNTPIGIVTINVDGQNVTYSRKQALEELEFWERRAARESGKRPRFAQIDLSGF